jgi:hypothetical protein
MAKTIPADEQVFMVSKSTNTTYSGSAALKAMNEWYTMEDVTNTVQPYKVFTVLLTQNGDDNIIGQNYGLLTIGVTYHLDEILNPCDFTNVGAPNNEQGTYFIATGTTPNNWGDDNTLTYNLGAPVATVLENTIGNVWFTYIADGIYTLNSNGLFTLGKSFSPNNQTVCYNYGDLTYNLLIENDNSLDINSIRILTTEPITFNPGNDYLTNKSIEIRVYN